MNNLFTGLNFTIPDIILRSANEQVPDIINGQMSIVYFNIYRGLFGKELSEFLHFTNSEIHLVSFIGNWHMPWQKNKKTKIRIPIHSHGSVEFLTDSPDTKKDTMIYNKYRTYNVPYEYGRPYIISNEYFHTVINYSDTIRHCIDVSVDMTYGEVVKYFKDRHLI